MNRILELTEIVEDFLREKGKEVSTGRYKIPKDIFLETLVDVEEIRVAGELSFRYNFLNSRLNKKYYFISRDIEELAEQEEIYSDIMLIILEHLEDKDHIEIDFDNYTKDNDDLSYIIYKADRRIKHKVLEYNYMEYERYKEDEESRKYFSQFGNLVYLDEDFEDGSIKDIISEDEAVTTPHSTVKYEEYLELLDKIRLTKRQREVLIELEKHNFNQRQTAISIGTSYKKLNEMFQRIKSRVEEYYKKPEREVTLRIRLEEELSKEDINTNTLIDIIKASVSDIELEKVVYSMDLTKRRLLIQHIKGKKLKIGEKDIIIKEYLKQYYSIYS